MKLNKRLLPWFIAAELSVIIVFVFMLIEGKKIKNT